MRRIASGQLYPWHNLRLSERSSRIAAARIAWVDDAEWDSLPEHARIFAAITLPMTRHRPDPFADTKRCLACQDLGFERRSTGIWFCQSCDPGLVREAGYWRKMRFPETRGRKVASTRGKREFDEHFANLPMRREQIRAAIAELVRKEHDREASIESET